MKIIEVLQKVAKGEIKEGTKLKIVDEFDGEVYVYEYNETYHNFKDEVYDKIEDSFAIDKDFLNYEVELIPPKPKKYMVKFNMRGLKENYRYLNYIESDECAHINDKRRTTIDKTQFTKQELQSIQPVREFLEDMEGKYELIEVEE